MLITFFQWPDVGFVNVPWYCCDRFFLTSWIVKRGLYIAKTSSVNIVNGGIYTCDCTNVVWWLSGQEKTDVLLKKTGNIKDEIKKNANILHRLLACLTEPTKGSMQGKDFFDKTIPFLYRKKYNICKLTFSSDWNSNQRKVINNCEL